MRLGLRAVIEAEYALDDAAERGGDLNCAAAHAAVAAGMIVTVQLDTERVAERANRAAEKHGAARAAGFDVLSIHSRVAKARIFLMSAGRAPCREANCARERWRRSVGGSLPILFAAGDCLGEEPRRRKTVTWIRSPGSAGPIFREPGSRVRSLPSKFTRFPIFAIISS